MRRLLIYSLFVLVASTSCAGYRTVQSGNGVSATPSPAPTVVNGSEPGDVINFLDPLVGGAKAENYSQAAATLSFTPEQPAADLGTVVQIDVSSSSFAEKYRAIAWAIADSNATTFDLVESPALITQAQLESEATCESNNPNCAAFYLVTLNDGQRALAIDGTKGEGGPEVSLYWLVNGTRFVLMGPAPFFTVQEATGLANSLTE